MNFQVLGNSIQRFACSLQLVLVAIFLLACDGMQPKGKLLGLSAGGGNGSSFIHESQIILFGPGAKTNEEEANFVFAVQVNGSYSFNCSLDGANFQSCQSPLQVSALEEGGHPLYE